MSEPSAFINSKDIFRVECFWWVGGGGENAPTHGDWMAIIYRSNETPNKLTAKYRFKYYEDDRVFHSDDRRAAYSCQELERSDLTKVITAFDELSNMMLKEFGGSIFRKRFAAADGTVPRFFHWLKLQPFAHMQTLQQHDQTRPQ